MPRAGWLLLWLLVVNLLFSAFYLLPDPEEPIPEKKHWESLTAQQCLSASQPMNYGEAKREEKSDHFTNLLSTYTGPEPLKQEFVKAAGRGIPPIIHQIHMSKTRYANNWTKDLSRWLASWDKENPSHLHIIWDDAQAEYFMKAFFTERIFAAYSRLPRIVQKADLLRYALLYQSGGYYVDSDTQCYRPVSEWPMEFKDCNVTFIAGAEWDAEVGRTNERGKIQLCQWAMASAPQHPILRAIINHVVDKAMAWSMEELQDVENVIELCGPRPWTDRIAEFLSLHGRSLDEIHSIALKDPKLFPGGVLILPASSFNWPYEGFQYSTRALLRHYVAGYRPGGWRNA